MYLVTLLPLVLKLYLTITELETENFNANTISITGLMVTLRMLLHGISQIKTTVARCYWLRFGQAILR